MLQLHTDYTNSSTLTTTSVYLLNMWGTFTTICGRITYVYVHLIINSHQLEYNVPVISWERPWIIGSCFLLSSLASCTEPHCTQDMILRHVSITNCNLSFLWTPACVRNQEIYKSWQGSCSILYWYKYHDPSGDVSV